MLKHLSKFGLIMILFSTTLVACEETAVTRMDPTINASSIPISPTELPNQVTRTPILQSTPSPELTSTMTHFVTTSTPELTQQSVAWFEMPVIPTVSDTAIGIYNLGISSGNNPQAFSKVGDGGVATSWFLMAFDERPEFYHLGPYEDLSAVIEQFSGSFGRFSLAADAGFSTVKILDPSFRDRDLCDRNETPLDCELRIHRPSFAFVSMGTNQIWAADVFQSEMRVIIEVLIEHGVVPILATKGDNLEGDQRINIIIADLAQEYDLPLWNFWLAIQSLPNHGMQEDDEHLTWAPNDFSNPFYMQHAWPVRNLTALQVLSTVWMGVQQ